jgi:hypothetical protein
VAAVPSGPNLTPLPNIPIKKLIRQLVSDAITALSPRKRESRDAGTTDFFPVYTTKMKYELGGYYAVWVQLII